MKKSILALSVVFLTASVSLAQDDKQDPKKDKKETKEEKPAGTRMAINEKGLPGTKKGNASTSKTSSSSTVTSSDKK